ncbi:MAG: AraC family transcriptional regulator [Prevotella sp.]|nr:AraC family transcriptional regulator [Prevotella sp.]
MRDVFINYDNESLEKIIESHSKAIQGLMAKVGELERLLGKQEDAASPSAKKPRKKQDLEADDKLLMKLKLLINEKQLHKREAVPLWEVAAAMNISQKRLKEIIGITEYYNLKNILNHYRINCACQMLLSHPAYSIEAIATESGFKSLKSFYRWFQREVGMSPTDYKQAQLGGVK